MADPSLMNALANPFIPDPIGQQQRMMSMQELGLRMQEQRQEMQSRNALRQVFADPSSFDPTTGTPNPRALARIMSIDPGTGMELQRNSLAIQEGKAKAWGAWEGVLKEGTEAAVSAYDAALPTGGPEAAQHAGQEVFSQYHDQFRTMGMPGELVRSLPTNFNYQRASMNLQTYAERQQRQDEQKKLAQTEADKQRQFGLEGQRIGLERERLTFEKGQAKAGQFDKPVEVEYTDASGQTKQALAQQNTKTGQWFTADEKRTPLSGTGMRVVKEGGASGREGVLIQRMLVDAKDATTEIRNITELPIEASTGWFGGRKQGPSLYEATKEVLATKVTSQEVQDYNSQAVGLGRALAGLETGGLQVNMGLMAQFEGLQLKEGDTNLTKIRKLATMRQQAENAIETVLTNPRLGKEQKEFAQNILKDLRTAVPWTVHDVNQVEQAQNPRATLVEFAKKTVSGGGGTKASPSSRGVEGTTITNTQADYDKLPMGARYRMPNDQPGSFRTKR